MALDPKLLYINANPMITDRVGQGINPKGEAYKYLINEL